GHSAFLALERIRARTAAGVPVGEAIEEVRRSTVFTTHTPVPAGNEVFSETEVLRYASGFARDAGLDDEALLKLGRFGENGGGFGLTPFALRLSAYANGVSALHGEVAREMWEALWPDRNGHVPPI